MAEIQRPYMNRIKRLAGLQAARYEFAASKFLPVFERAEFVTYGNRYLSRLDTADSRSDSEANLLRVIHQVSDSSLRALALQLHLSGNEECLAILVQASIDGDPNLVTRPLELAVRSTLARTPVELFLDLRSFGKKIHPHNGKH